MKITLKECLKQKLMGIENPLELKMHMIKAKDEGLVFFIEEMLTLELDQPFELYFATLPNENQEINAFPIPLEHLNIPKNKKAKMKVLCDYFMDYYGTKPDEKHLENIKQFTGQNYAWFYIS